MNGTKNKNRLEIVCDLFFILPERKLITKRVVVQINSWINPLSEKRIVKKFENIFPSASLNWLYALKSNNFDGREAKSGRRFPNVAAGFEISRELTAGVYLSKSR